MIGWDFPISIIYALRHAIQQQQQYPVADRLFKQVDEWIDFMKCSFLRM